MGIFAGQSSGDATVDELIVTGNITAAGDIDMTSATPVMDASGGAVTLGINTVTNRPVTFGTGLVTAGDAFTAVGVLTGASLVCTAGATFGGGFGDTGASISTAGVGQFNGALTTDGVLTGASLVCTAGATFGGGYGDTGASISTAGVGQFNGALTTDGALTADSASIAATVSMVHATVPQIDSTLATMLLNVASGEAITTGSGLFTAGGSLTVTGTLNVSGVTNHMMAGNLQFDRNDAASIIGTTEAFDFLVHAGGALAATFDTATKGFTTVGGVTVGTDLSVGDDVALTGANPVIDSSIAPLGLNTVNNEAITTGSGLFTAGGAMTVTGAMTADNIVCTNAATFGGGYGATGATISTAGVGQFNGALTADGLITGGAGIGLTGSITVGSGAVITTPVTITTDTTPSVSGMNDIIIGAWTAANDITTFDDGAAGQTLNIIGGDTDCNIVDGASMNLVSGTTWNAATGATLILHTWDGTNWYELHRSVT